MTEERSTHPEEPEKKPRPWRPTYRQVFWAIGLVVALVTITLLVAGLYPDIWLYLSGEHAMLIGIGVALVAVIVLLAIGGASLGWTGFRGKTLWDLLQLLIVPLVLVGIGFLFEMQQAERQAALDEQQRWLERQQQLLAEQRAQDEALQAYLDQMSQLMLERKLLEAEQGDPVHTLAQARTSTVILSLDAEHNESVTRFLSNSGLAASSKASAGLLREIPLSHAKLRGAYLPNADLSYADLSGADLSNAYLIEADLSGADLSNADLRSVLLPAAGMLDVDLSGADLRGANIADLRGANALFIPPNKLAQQAESLEGATMPNGQKYEDWLKSKENGKNE